VTFPPTPSSAYRDGTVAPVPQDILDTLTAVVTWYTTGLRPTAVAAAVAARLTGRAVLARRRVRTLRARPCGRARNSLTSKGVPPMSADTPWHCPATVHLQVHQQRRGSVGRRDVYLGDAYRPWQVFGGRPPGQKASPGQTDIGRSIHCGRSGGGGAHWWPLVPIMRPSP